LHKLSDTGSKFSLIIVGDGGEREHLELAVRDYGLTNIYFEGAIYDERELSRYFMISDIFVTPGVASLAIKMAMLFGKPIVTVDYGLEVHDVQDGVNGFIFPVDDDQALAGCLRRLIDSDELARKMGENGRRLIRHEINIRTMIEGFRRAIFDEPDIDTTASESMGDSARIRGT
jgi:glycosyltransferase involved in cell wall biosynthesis